MTKEVQLNTLKVGSHFVYNNCMYRLTRKGPAKDDTYGVVNFAGIDLTMPPTVLVQPIKTGD